MNFYEEEYDMMRDFIIMVGLSGSGKSTRTKELVYGIHNSHPKYDNNGRRFDEVDVISSDEIRLELLGDVNDQSQNDKVFAEVKRRAIESIKNYKHVIIDATNVTIKDRASVLSYFDAVKSFRKDYAITAYVMDTSLEDCKIRNSNREKKVPVEVIIKQLYKYEIPFYEEGFDYIIIDGYTKQEKYNFSSLLKILRMMNGFDQRNSHHVYDLLAHCTLCQKLIYDKTNSTLMEYVGKIHDLGKLFTATPKQDFSGEYRYLQHHNVGAYYLLTHRDMIPGFTNENPTKDEILTVIFYVNYHMMPFFWQGEKSNNKYKKLFGENKYNALLMFNECDKIASGTGEENED